MIYITHGTVPSWSSERISHALFLPETQVETHLQLRTEKYVPLEQALHGHGDALTIDDATYGALKLALLARSYGHSVSWFVNGSHVEHGIQYYPFQLSSMLDSTRARDCRFDGVTWNLQEMAGRRALRLRIKETYMRLRSHEEIEQLIERLACCLHIDPAMMERSLSTVGAAELAQAVAAGVDLHNHSWSHLNPQVFSEQERSADALKNEEFLSQFRTPTTRVFAPPFGQYVSLSYTHTLFVLLANRNMMCGHREGNLVNRSDLVLNTTRPTPPTTRHRAKIQIAA